MKIIKFSAPWCTNCRPLIPIFEKLKEEYKQIEFIDVNVDNEPELATAYGLTSIPTVVIQKDIISEMIVGAKPYEEYKNAIEKILV